jgi:ABC-type sulfate/molybdate transport systems ATPase subunit
MLNVQIALQLRAYQLDISFSLHSSEILVIIGENGAGKSTILNAITGIITPDSGEINLSGLVLFSDKMKIDLLPEERKIGYVFQNYALFPHMTVLENVMFGLQCRRVPAYIREEEALTWLVDLNLYDHRHQRVTALSGGEQQRVALARALVIRPDLLLLDEPLSALDALTRVEVRKNLKTCIRNSGVPAIVVTHDPDDAWVLGDRICVLKAGNIIQMGPPDMFIGDASKDYGSTFFCRCSRDV